MSTACYRDNGHDHPYSITSTQSHYSRVISIDGAPAGTAVTVAVPSGQLTCTFTISSRGARIVSALLCDQYPLPATTGTDGPRLPSRYSARTFPPTAARFAPNKRNSTRSPIAAVLFRRCTTGPAFWATARSSRPSRSKSALTAARCEPKM